MTEEEKTKESSFHMALVYASLEEALDQVNTIGNEGYSDWLMNYMEPIWLDLDEEHQDILSTRLGPDAKAYLSLERAMMDMNDLGHEDIGSVIRSEMDGFWHQLNADEIRYIRFNRKRRASLEAGVAMAEAIELLSAVNVEDVVANMTEATKRAAEVIREFAKQIPVIMQMVQEQGVLEQAPSTMHPTSSSHAEDL